jgi:hypothetical protein
MDWCSSSRRSAGLPVAGSIKSSKNTRKICEDHQEAPPSSELRPPQLAASFIQMPPVGTKRHFVRGSDMSEVGGRPEVAARQSK